jgi:hypothetical protein
VIDSALADRLGVDRQAPREIVAEYLLRQAGRSVTAANIPQLAIELSYHLAGAMEEGANAAASEMIGRLQRVDAPAVLALIEPHQVVGGCPAKDLGTACKGLVRRHLVGFCLNVLDTWTLDRPGPGNDPGAPDADLG